MSRLSSLIVVVVAACGGSPKPAPGVPLPEDTNPAPDAAPAAPATAAAPTPPPPVATAPLDVKVPALDTTVKLVSSGTGKKQAMRYTLKPGAKQTVEFAMDFTGKQDADTKIVPTLVLTGEAETKAVDPAGNAEFAVTITSTDARAVEGSQIPLEQFKKALGALSGLTIGGKLNATGTAGELTLHLANAPAELDQALQLIQLTLPRLPVLPKDAIGVGARWQSVTPAKLIERLDVTQTTEYQVTAHKGTTWTITGKTTVAGKDQEIEGAKITGISGTGTSETTIADGVMYPSHKGSLETQFKVSDKDKSATVVIKLGGAVTPKAP